MKLKVNNWVLHVEDRSIRAVIICLKQQMQLEIGEQQHKVGI